MIYSLKENVLTQTRERPQARPNPIGAEPQIHPTAFVDPTAQLIGRVRVGPRVYVGPFVVIRNDEVGSRGEQGEIEVMADCNVQDGVIIHALGGTNVRVGPKTSLTHGCIVHGPCEIGANSFIGFRSVVFAAKLGQGVHVDVAAVVKGVSLGDCVDVAPGLVVVQQDQADLLPETSDVQKLFMQNVIRANLRLASGYADLE